MNQVVLRNANLATMVEGQRPFGMLEGATLRIQDGMIADITLNGAPDQSEEGSSEIDCGGMLLTPGLIDCHTHLVHAGNRAKEFSERLSGSSYADQADQGKGILSTVAQTRSSSTAELYRQSMRRLEALMGEGVTTVEIKTGYGLNTVPEKKMLRVACELESNNMIDVHKTFLGAHAVPGEFSGDADAYIDYVCSEMLPQLAATGELDSVDAFCDTVGFTVDQVRRVFASASEHELPVRLHAEQLSDSGGARLAADHGALSVDHLEYLNPSDARYLARKDTTAVLLPGAYYFLLGTKKPPVDALRANGVPMAVATDCNPGSSPLCSLLIAMNMACILFGLTPEESVAGVTRNAAQALGEAASKGTIEVGKRADLVLWDLQDPARLCYPLGENRCSRVWVNGVERT